ncbi:MAG: adenylate/guanylate cyclase domain-containing protein [Bdellovibrionia bacterium]
MKNMRFPIVVKLVTVTVVLMLAATAPIAIISYWSYEKSAIQREDLGNITLAEAVAARAEGLLTTYVDKIGVVGSMLYKGFATPDQRENALSLSFHEDRDLVSVEVYEMKDGKPELVDREINEKFLTDYGETRDFISSVHNIRKIPLGEVFEGKIEIRNSWLPAKKTETDRNVSYPPLVTIAIPIVKNEELGRYTHVAVADIAMNRLQEMFANESERTIYLIDKRGIILAHPNEEWLTNAYSMKKISIVRDSFVLDVKSKQSSFNDPDTGEPFLGAFVKTQLGVTVIAQVSKDVILEPAREIRRKIMEIASYVMFIAFFFIFLFSITITTPIEKLVVMAREVARGNFDAKAGVRSKDEVGELARAFEDMTVGLKERDKIKNVFNKFHGSSVTEDLLQGDLSLGGSNKEVTVFFSDIRDFTKFSEGHTPEEVVNMLNEYFGIMVGIINKNHGVVDKFIGDAIMAVWGAPKSTGNDQHNAVKACIEMRIALNELNERRGVRGQTPIKIGIGIHSGRAISGTIGSSERMEYTVIGDTVNTTSRIEASTKAFGTDLLVSAVTAGALEGKFVFEYAGAAEVKGKAEPLKMFKVRGFVDQNGQPVLVRTPYSDYEAGDADKVKIAS